jgi:hypothetical protein
LVFTAQKPIVYPLWQSRVVPIHPNQNVGIH